MGEEFAMNRRETNASSTGGVGTGTPPGATAAFWAMMAGVFLAAMDSTVVATALPAIVADLGGAALLSWVITSYLLATAVSIPLWGKAADLASRRRLYLAATVVFLVSSVLVAAAPSMPALLAARAVQGVGTGGLMALTPTILADLFPARIRGRYQGRQGAILAAASIVGPLVGGVFVGTVGWRAAFWINLPLAGIALAVVVRRLHLAVLPREKRPLDVVGAGLLTAATIAVLLAVAEGTPLASAPWRIPVLAFAAAAAATYLRWQTRHADPVLPLRILRSRIVAAAIALSFLIGAAMLAVTVYVPLYAQTVQGRPAAAAGALFLPLTIGVLVASTVAGNLITRTGRYRPFPIAGTVAVTAGYALLATLDSSTGPVLITAALALVGTGVGLVIQPAVLALQNAVEQRDLGAATAASTFFRQLGSTLAVGLLGGLLASRAGPALTALTTSPGGAMPASQAQASVAAAVGDLFLALAAVSAISVVIAVLLPAKPLASGSTNGDDTSHTPRGSVESPGGEPSSSPRPR
jgi:EmrB/QacA subfamily drug resistance transporter